MRKKLAIVFLSATTLIIVFIYQTLRFSDGKMHVAFCDVGQGDAIFIRTPKGSDILIDGGPNDSVLNCLSNNMPFWDRDLELVILSHPHADHLNGLISVAKRYKILSFNTAAQGNSDVYKELIKILKDEGVPIRFIFQGDRFRTGDNVIFEVYWPKRGSYSFQASDKNMDENNLSVVAGVFYKNFSMVLTGDVGAKNLDSILIHFDNLDIVKIPHHGSKTGIDENTFLRLKPALAVISVGKNNKYNLPNSGTLSILKELGIKTLRTDENGEVRLVSDGKSFEVRSEK